MLLDMNVYYKVDGIENLFAMTSCSAESISTGARSVRRQMLVPSLSSNGSSMSLFDSRNQTADMEILRRNGNVTSIQSNGTTPSILAAVSALAGQLKLEKNGEPTQLFAISGSIVVGLYAGSQIDTASVVPVIQGFATRASSTTAQQTVAQLCQPGFLSTQVLGIAVDTTGNLGSVRDLIRGWRDAECVSKSSWDSTDIWNKAPIVTIPGKDIPVGPDAGIVVHVDKRQTCSYTQAQSGEGCWALENRCNITEAQLLQYNNNPKLCDVGVLQAGQYVCCNPGSLPDFSPQPNPDGSCKTTTFNGDLCGVIAQKNQMTVDQIEQRNKNTWGWAGCNFLQPNQVFCLSEGSPPMPPPLSNAVCGPQVNNTKKPANMNDLANLNPCPLKACCDVWGQCGTTAEFCTKTPGPTGAPGTTIPGTSSCISNCGTDIINNKNPPTSFMKLGYFEGFNPSRPCLHMRPSQINTKVYTHVHYAFAGITNNFDVNITGQETIFNEFKAINGVKRIVSFGGWSFSTETDTFPIFRAGVTAAQRDAFAKNVVKFLNDNNLDGLDFDWEYPGAPDIPGIPPGSKDDGPNYLAFLQLVRKYLPAGKSLSIAAPASFWYLRGFPIADMSNVVDYIVYMTYDLHGQWDWDHPYSEYV
jgi:chitinase